MTILKPDASFRVGTERLYPCRCGETHSGQYAYEEWLHHNCYHDGEWVIFPLGKDMHQLICISCGKSALGVMEQLPSGFAWEEGQRC